MLQAGRKARALAAVLAAVVALGVGAAASVAAVPARFFGVVPQSTLTQAQFNTLKRGGVKEMRVAMIWSALQPRRGAAEWADFDPIVERAAKSGIELLPFVIGAPTWAVPEASVPGTGGAAKAPARLPAAGAAGRAWSNFLKAAVARYGPGGTYWSENPLVPDRPIKAWQVWNEPNFKYFVARPNPTQYGKLVKLSAAAIKSVDPSAQVILAGLFAKPAGARHLKGRKVIYRTSPNWFGSYFLEQMYKTSPGIRSRFQGVALHPYVARYRWLPAEIEELRTVMSRAGDGAKALWITELGWSSEPPQGPSNVFAVGAAGQARELRGAFTLLERDAARYRLKRVYWFSVDDAAETCNFCNGSGLFRKGFAPKRSWTEFTKFTRARP